MYVRVRIITIHIRNLQAPYGTVLFVVPVRVHVLNRCTSTRTRTFFNKIWKSRNVLNRCTRTRTRTRAKLLEGGLASNLGESPTPGPRSLTLVRTVQKHAMYEYSTRTVVALTSLVPKQQRLI